MVTRVGVLILDIVWSAVMSQFMWICTVCFMHEFGAVLEGFLFSTYLCMLVFISLCRFGACSVLGSCFVGTKCHKHPCLITSFYGISKNDGALVLY